MFDIKICPAAPKSITTFWLYRDNNRIGNIIAYPYEYNHLQGHDKTRCVIEIYIEAKYRNRWLTRPFKEEIKSFVINTLKHKNIKEIHSKALAPQSPRLLDFFGFKRYNSVYYKLNI